MSMVFSSRGDHSENGISISLDDLLSWEALDFKETSGHRGAQLNIRECQNPDCDSEKWKVYANAESGQGNCFSCGATFNVFSFVRMMLKKRGGNPSNSDVGRYIADVARKLGYRPKRKETVTVAVEEGDVELPFSVALPYENGNHPYLEGRGISGEWAKRYHLRFSSFGHNKYQDTKGELIKQSFADRIIIPVYDLNGKLVTFQGRDITGFAEQKYKFAGGLPGTGRYLYQGHVALALKAKHVVMCEGAFDVIPAQIALSMFEQTKGVVAIGSWGKHLTSAADGDDQVQAFQRLKRAGLETVTIMWDGEPEAYEAALKAADDLLKIGLTPRIALLPKGKDPNEVDAVTVVSAYATAKPYTRLSALRMRMNNPYRD